MTNTRWVLSNAEEFRLETESVGPVSDGWVRIRSAYCGICGSDLHSYRGRHPMVRPPIVLGHEFSGVVVDVGEGCSRGLVGKRVVASPSIPCGKCYQCKSGQEHICQNLMVVGNIGVSGAFAEYVDVPRKCVLEIPDTMSLPDAAMVEPTAVAVHALRKVRLEGGVLVIGAGPIGLLTALVAKAQGLDPVGIVDVRQERLDVARKMGLRCIYNSRERHATEEIRRDFADGPGAVFDCVAVSDSLNLALRVARKGSSIVLEGVPEEPLTVDAVYIQDRELQLVGTLMYQIPDLQEAIQLIVDEAIPVHQLITRKVPFQNVPEIFQELSAGHSQDIKVLVAVSPEWSDAR